MIVRNPIRFGPLAAGGALAALAFLGSSCAVGPKYQRPSAVTPAAFKEPPPPGWKEARPNDEALGGKWWEIFNDPLLNSLEEPVNISNQNVLAAEAQFRQAKAAVSIARASLFPLATGGATIASTHSSSVLGSGRAGAANGAKSLFNLPLDISYQADLWGSIHRTVTADRALAQASAAQLAAVRLLIQSEIAADYYSLRGLDGDSQLLEATVKSFEDFLDLTKNRYASGIASMGDVAQAQTQLETTRAQWVDVGVQRAQFEHAIAVLTGRPPAGFSIPVAGIAALPPSVPLGVPSALLERRPDIAAGERQVAAANEQIGIAKAAFYPVLTLSAGAGLQSSSFVDWFTWPARFWSVGPQLAQTLFDAGRRRAQVSLVEAGYDATVAGYRQTVLTAFQQVEDSLAALRILASEAGVESRAVKSAQQSLEISTVQYKGGVASYLQVITAQTAALDNQRAEVAILTRRMLATVSLIEALGGGWDSSQLPTDRDLYSSTK